MNVFAAVGTISELEKYDNRVKFCLAIRQEKPCKVPCVVFNPTAAFIQQLEGYQSRGQVLWLHGRLSSFDLEIAGHRVARKIEVMTYPKGIQPIQ